MGIQEARQLIGDPNASMMTRIQASHVLSLSDDSTLADLVNCLRCRGVIAELAAVGLYRRTARPKSKRWRDWVNPDQWEQYLIRARLEREAESAG
jgi:hypothetical protein